jgi:hypothetical protein
VLDKGPALAESEPISLEEGQSRAQRRLQGTCRGSLNVIAGVNEAGSHCVYDLLDSLILQLPSRITGVQC